VRFGLSRVFNRGTYDDSFLAALIFGGAGSMLFWLASSLYYDASGAFRDITSPPVTLWGEVRSRRVVGDDETGRSFYLTVDFEEFEVNSQIYAALAEGERVSMTYWPNTRIVASVERLPTRSYWPATVVQLAEAVCDGQDCSFALHDALLDAGHTELAEHFRKPEDPRQRSALIMILGRN
jgi:hypothetical protein